MNGVLRGGAAVVLMPRFDLEQFLGLIEEHRITKAHLVPPIILALAKSPAVEGRDLSSLRFVNSGAAPLSAELAAAAAERIGCPRRPGLRHDRDEPGHAHHAARRRTARARSARRSRTRSSASSTTETGEEAERRASCAIRGPQVMLGYLTTSRPRATRSTRTAGCTPATWAAPTTTATSTSSTASRSSSSTRASRSRPPSSRRSSWSIRRWPTRRSSASPTRRPARSPRRSSC